MGAHLIDGEFQSDKYPTTPRGKVPLSVKDPMAQDLLWQYAQRRREVDAEFSADLETALKGAGYDPGRPSFEAEVVRRLLALAAAVYFALDDSEEIDDSENIDGGGKHVIEADHVKAVCDLLDQLDELPDDQPGYTMSAPAKARWALRSMPGVRETEGA